MLCLWQSDPWTLERFLLILVPDKLLERMFTARQLAMKKLAAEKKEKEQSDPKPEFNL